MRVWVGFKFVVCEVSLCVGRRRGGGLAGFDDLPQGYFLRVYHNYNLYPVSLLVRGSGERSAECTRPLRWLV